MRIKRGLIFKVCVYQLPAHSVFELVAANEMGIGYCNPVKMACYYVCLKIVLFVCLLGTKIGEKYA